MLIRCGLTRRAEHGGHKPPPLVVARKSGKDDSRPGGTRSRPHSQRMRKPPHRLHWQSTQLTRTSECLRPASPWSRDSLVRRKFRIVFLLKAARENRRLAPHSWQRVALMPTRAPHAGQIFGRGCCSPPKNPRIVFFHLSTRHCHR